MREVSSFEDLRELCEPLCRPERETLFRGQEVADWRLETRFDRLLRRLGCCSKDRWLQAERTAVESFEKRAYWQLDIHEKVYFHQGYSSLEKDGVLALQVMQHHGTPTRLLDWSARWEVAAYFAVAGELSEDGAIWSFDNRALAAFNDAKWSEWGVPRRTDTKQAHFEHVAFEPTYPHRWIVAMKSLSPFVRMAVQQGWHTAAPQHLELHDDALCRAIPNGAGRLQKFVIRKGLKVPIREALEARLGVCARTLHWPGADYAAQKIIGDIDCEN